MRKGNLNWCSEHSKFACKGRILLLLLPVVLASSSKMESKKAKKRQATSDPDPPTSTDEVDLGKNYNILNC